MKELIKLAITVIVIFSSIGSIVFYLKLADYTVRISQGDYTASQDMAEYVAEEVTDTMIQSVVIYVLIALFSALGLTGIAALLKKLL